MKLRQRDQELAKLNTHIDNPPWALRIATVSIWGVMCLYPFLIAFVVMKIIER